MTPGGANMRCGDTDALVSFLYDECDGEERARMAQHLQSCEPWSAELAGLADARHHLGTWAPPDAALGFRISAAPAAAPVLSSGKGWWRQPMPAWAQAVAAAVLFGLGLAAGSRSQGNPTVGPERAVSVSAAELGTLETSLRDEIAALRRASTPTDVKVSAPEPDHDAVLMRQVRQLVRESEARQQETFAVRAAQLVRDSEIQRRVDQATVQRSLAQMQGTTGEEVRRQREMLDYLVNVSQRGGR
jgi:hypothetical protein